MSIERRSEVIPASGELSTPRNNFFLLLSATGTVNMRAEGRGTSERFDGITGGILIRRVNSWDFMTITGAAGLTVVYLVGTELVERDETDVRLQIATIAGTASVADSPASALADTAAVALPDATLTAVVPVNLTRRRVTITVDADALTPVYARTAGGANNLLEMQPGVAYEFRGTYAISIRNDSGGATTAYVFEES